MLSDVPADSPAFQAKPVIEIRERFDRRIDRDFSSLGNDNTNLAYSRWRIGGESVDREGRKLRVVYQLYWDISKRQGGPEASSLRSDLYEASYLLPIGSAEIKAGRQEVVRGDGRIFGNSDWGTGLSWDGVRIHAGAVEGFIGQMGASSRANHEVRMGYVGYTWDLGQTTALYTVNGRPVPEDQIWALDHYWTGRRGKWTYWVEGTVQGGKRGGKTLSAFSGFGRAQYRVNPAWSVHTEVALASGGESAGRSSSNDPLFISTHNRYGVIDMQTNRNFKGLNLGVTHTPDPNVSVRLDYWKFYLYDKTDGWFGTSGAINPRVGGLYIDPTGAAGDDLGSEIDLYGTLKIAPNHELLAGASVFMPGSFQKSFNPGTSRNQYWIYAQWQVKF